MAATKWVLSSCLCITLMYSRFLTIVPISPDGTRHFWSDNVLEILNEVKKNYKVNSDKVYVTGFSMGSVYLMYL